MGSNYPSKTLDIICFIFSEMGDKFGIGIVLIFSYNIMDLPKSFIVTLSTATGQAFISLLKSIYNEPRPFFVADIKPFKCRLEHGNPSGHALIVVAIYATFCEMIIRQYQFSKTKQNLIWSVYFLFVSFIGFGRIYNGVHTYNQVISGYVFGLVIYYTYCHIFYYEICRFISNIHKKSVSQLLWNTFTQGFIISYLFAILLYFYGSKNHPTPQFWLDNIMKNCEDVDLNADPDLQNFEKYNLSFSMIGALLGIALEQKYLDTRQFHIHYQTSWATTFKKVALNGICGIVFFAPYLVSKHNPFFIVLIFRNIFPTLFGNMHVFGTQKWISHKLDYLTQKQQAKTSQVWNMDRLVEERGNDP